MPFKKPHQTSDADYITQNNGGYEIKPRGLNIVWGNDGRYWKITNEGTAELIQVSWLEVSGKVEVKKGNNYMVKFDVQVKQDGFGWNGTKVLVMAKIGKRGQYTYKDITLTPGQPLSITLEDVKVPHDEVWSGVENKPELHFGLYEVWSGKWKGGLEIKKAEILKQ